MTAALAIPIEVAHLARARRRAARADLRAAIEAWLAAVRTCDDGAEVDALGRLFDAVGRARDVMLNR